MSKTFSFPPIIITEMHDSRPNIIGWKIKETIGIGAINMRGINRFHKTIKLIYKCY